MSKLKWATILRWLLAAFFAVGGIGNIIASETILAEYERWGYPAWFHFVTGILELVTATFLMTRYRLVAAFLGCAVMAGAIVTVVSHGEYSHAIPPLLVFSLTALLALTLWKKRRL